MNLPVHSFLKATEEKLNVTHNYTHNLAWKAGDYPPGFRSERMDPPVPPSSDAYDFHLLFLPERD